MSCPLSELGIPTTTLGGHWSFFGLLEVFLSRAAGKIDHCKNCLIDRVTLTSGSGLLVLQLNSDQMADRSSPRDEQHSVKSSDDNDPLETSRTRVRRNVIISTSLSALFAAFAYRIIPIDRLADSLQTPADRVVFTLRCNVLTIGIILALAHKIGNTRFRSKQINPFSSDDRIKVEVGIA